jgi:zinc protease
MTRYAQTDAVSGNHLFPRLVASILALAVFTFPAIAPVQAAVKIQEVTSEKGISAWLVEDYTVPIITVRFAFKGGSTQDPETKDGLATLITGLFDEGAGDLEADAFQEKLDEVGAEMGFEATSDAIYGEMRMLADSKDEALGLLELALISPRFDQEPVDRIRSQIVTRIQRDMRDPNALGREKFSQALYGDHPYARPSDGTLETLGSISPADLKHFHRRVFARSNISIAVVGAIDAETLGKELDRVFGDLPEQADLTPVAYVAPKLDQQVDYEYALPQSSIQLVYPGLKRDDPAFFDAFIMNHILGGGSFSSRLFNEVREKRGLTYGIGSSLVTSDFSDSLFIGTSTRADRVEEALTVIRDEVRRMAEEGPTVDELAKAKTYLVGAYPINNLDSSSAVARTLVELQKEKRGIDYINRRVGYIEAVTLEGVKAAAQRLLQAEPAILVIGPKSATGG